MQALLSIQESLFTPEKAEEVAVMLNNDIDDDFTYKVIHDPKGTGKSFIRVYDDEGFYVGKV
jgi:hypothetical protein